MGKFLCKFQGHHKYTRISVTLFRLSEAEDIFYIMNKNHYMWFQHLSGISELCFRGGAGEVLFFRPVFNLADSAITVAVILILLFFSKDLNDTLSNGKEAQKVEA